MQFKIIQYGSFLRVDNVRAVANTLKALNFTWMWTLIACSLEQGSSSSIVEEIPTGKQFSIRDVFQMHKISE
ncbi:hypothetical protein RHGRI_004476 [Rhododendron griersonianum]|uniref:Uncharacterized protein n=1 Tax=Rhododendron griersonianum TaxID=479676 RepID=A0AAV6L8U9_9ERIC|nr:hypothetical protein RHGRI_004476 [Rhododendron griersonianum]